MSQTYYCEGCSRDTELRKLRVVQDNPDHGNMLLCRRCFEREIRNRQEQLTPKWEDCEVVP